MSSYLDKIQLLEDQGLLGTVETKTSLHDYDEINDINEISDLPKGGALLLQRLRKGVEWLTEIHNRLLESGERYTALEDRFLEGIDRFDALDYQLRFVYPEYEVCIFGPDHRCPDDSPVSCRACGIEYEGNPK